MKKAVLKKQQRTMKQSITLKFATGILITLALVVTQSCKKDDPDPEPTPVEKPEITSVSPLEGAPDATVTINGKNFKDGTTGVAVTFRGVDASVTSSATAKIVCEVPDIAKGAAAIIVTVDGNASVAYTGFEVVEEVLPATITSFTPDNGSNGDVVTITGTNFKTGGIVDSVTINGKKQEMDPTSSDTEIKITLAEKTFSGKVSVWKSGVEYSASNLYNYVEEYEVVAYSDAGASDLAVDKNNILYKTYGNEIIRVAEDGSEIDTLFPRTKGSSPQSLFFAEDGTLYVGDQSGRILYMPAGENAIDTLIKIGENPNVKINETGRIVGDNKGYLYMLTNSFGYSVVKINLNNTNDTKVIFEEPNDESLGYITFHEDRIYITTVHGVSSFKTDGSDYKRLVDDATKQYHQSGILAYHTGQIYLFNNNSKLLYKMDKTGNLEEAFSAQAYNKEHRPMTEDKNGDILLGYSSIEKIIIK